MRTGIIQDARETQKLSERVKEMALRLLKNPEEATSSEAFDMALIMATSAWNVAVGNSMPRDQYREMLEEASSGHVEAWEELVAKDSERLIGELVEYKRTHFPDDQRRIAGFRVDPERGLQVHWVADDQAAGARSGPSRADSDAPRAAKRRSVSKKKPRSTAQKLIARMRKETKETSGQVVSLPDVLAGRALAEELQESVATPDDLADLHPAHALYVLVQNQAAVLAEQLAELKELTALTEMISQAEEYYLPSGPPMSPLTGSYFTSWLLFDACLQPGGETLGSTITEISAAFGMPEEILQVFGFLERSRMGVYVHEGRDGDLTLLRDIVTGAACPAIVPAGYPGKKGELWYARVLPPPFPGGYEHVVFTTPYVLTTPGMRAWEAYFRRVLPDVPEPSRLDAYEAHMKYGPTPSYWHDFVAEAYVNHETEAIFLAGLPDVPESRPDFMPRNDDASL